MSRKIDLYPIQPITSYLTIDELSSLENAFTYAEKGDADFIFPFLSEDLIFDSHKKLWFIWNINHWENIKEDELITLVSSNLESAYKNYLDRLPSPNIIPYNNLYVKDGIRNKLSKVGFISNVKNIIGFLKSRFSIEYDKPIPWNEKLYLLPAIIKDHNGKQLPEVIDLRTGKTILAQKKDYISRYCETEYTGAFPYKQSDLPFLNRRYGIRTWQDYLKMCVNNPQHDMFFEPGLSPFDDFEQDITGYKWQPDSEHLELLRFKQRIMGMILMTGNEQQKCIFCIGEGADGKSEEYGNILYQVLGDIVRPGLEADLLMTDPSKLSNNKKLGSYLITLGGKSFAIFTEPDDTNKVSKFSASAIKLLTGEKTIFTDGKYKDPEDVKRTYTPVVLVNNKPVFPVEDYAIQRRIIPFPYTEQYMENPDPNNPHQHPIDIRIAEKVLINKSAVLSWLVRGCITYWNSGKSSLGIYPKLVMDEMDDIKAVSDLYSDFIDSEVIVTHDPNHIVKARDFYNKYVKYMMNNGTNYPPSETQFGKYMKKKFPQKSLPGKGVKVYWGIIVN